MIKEIVSNLYCIELPLPQSPLKYINCYVIKGKDRSLIIDTGMNREECKSALFPALKELKVDMAKTDLFITHLHADHFGLTGDLATPTSKCYVGRIDAEMIRGGHFWQELLQIYAKNGFPEEVLKKSMAGHPGIIYNSQRAIELTPVDDGQKIEVGDFELQCIDTPGHSPGHACLYEANKKILFSGDHILFDITPNITYWMLMKDALRSYLASLDKVAHLEVKNVLPGHRKSWHNHQGRIEELKKHHRHRLDEALAALKEREMTAYEVAPHITWKIEFAHWDDFPIVQKYFAFGETLAHLYYLENDGLIKSYSKNGHTYFALA